MKSTRKVEFEYGIEDLLKLIKSDVRTQSAVVGLNSRVKIDVSFDVGSDPTDDGYGGGFSRQVLRMARVTVTALD